MSAEIEPVHGLPEALPAGETILWQGAPRWQTLARTGFHADKVAIYFCVLAVWQVLADSGDGEGPAAILAGVALLVAGAAAAIAVLAFLAWLSARVTVYTITTRRVVMRIGVALPLTINVPYRIVRSAGLKLGRDGSGDIALALTGEDRLAYLALWPHARPWRLGRPEPMLRAVPEGARVAAVLSGALAAEAGLPALRAVEERFEPAGSRDAPASAAA